jgi:PAS domain S-box-containing protein
MGNLLDEISDAVVVFDQEWKIQYVNRSYLDLVAPLYRTADELLGSTLWENFPDVVGTPDEAAYRRAMAAQEAETIESYYGPIMAWLEIRITPTGNGLALCVRNHSRRTEAERLLRHRSERLQLLSEALAQLISAEDPETVVRELFPKVAEHLQVDTYFNFMVHESGDRLYLHSSAGLSEEDRDKIAVIEFGQSLCGRMALDRQPVVLCEVQASLSEEAAAARSLGLTAYAGNPLLSGDRLLGTLSFASRKRDSFEEDELEFLRMVSHSAAVALDRLQHKERMQRSDALYRAIGESIKYGIWVCDAEGRNTQVSDSFLELTGITQEECSGFGWGRLLHPDDASDAIPAWRECAAKGDFWEREFRFRGVDGRWHPMLARGVPVRNEEGKVQCWAGINLDIADIKRTEEALATQKRILEALNRLGSGLAGELDMDRLLHLVVEGGRAVTGASYGAFLQNSGTVERPLFTVQMQSGGPADLMEACTDSQGADGLARICLEGGDPPPGCLMTPVTSTSRGLLGLLVFLHGEPGFFDLDAQQIVAGMAGQTATALDNAHLYDRMQKTADRLNLAMEAAKLGDWTWDTASDVVDLSSSAAAIFGIPERTGLRWQEMLQRLHPDDRATAIQGVRRALDGEADYDVEYRIRRADGSTVWVAVRGRATRDADNRPTGLRGVVQDITERKHAGEAFAALSTRSAQQSHLFDATLSHIADLAYTFDCEGRVIYANQPLLKIWGRRLDEVVGKNCYELGYPQDLADRLHGELLSVAATGERVLGETEFVGADHTVETHEYIYNPVFDDEGRVVAVAGTTRLITDRKRTENELKVAKEAAEAANLAKDRFLAVLSHELRTPLTPVLMTVASLEMDAEVPPTVRDDLAMIRRNVELETKLIDDLLDLSRITSGKLRLQLQEISPYAAVRHACGICRSQVLEKQIHLHCEVEDGPELVQADPARLQQVLWNVLKNAVKFTPEGGDVYVTSRVQESGWLEIRVRDTGIGIPPELLAPIFEAFEQGDAVITRRFGGLGLGLSISKALVELHRGRIYAESPGPGQGATVILELPVARQGAKREPLPLSPTPPVAAGGPRPRILLAEDHEDTARTLTRLLAARGYEVKQASTVGAALELAEQEHFDLLVSDIGLPDASGLDLMRTLAQQSQIKGIAMSGYGMDEDIRRSREAGFEEHLTKPVAIAQLHQAIERLARSLFSPGG